MAARPFVRLHQNLRGWAGGKATTKLECSKGVCSVRWRLGCGEGDEQGLYFVMYSCLLVRRVRSVFCLAAFPVCTASSIRKELAKRYVNIVIRQICDAISHLFIGMTVTHVTECEAPIHKASSRILFIRDIIHQCRTARGSDDRQSGEAKCDGDPQILRQDMLSTKRCAWLLPTTVRRRRPHDTG